MLGQCPKILKNICICVYSLLLWPKFCFFMQLFLKILSGMANRVDPDQTAPSGVASSGSAVFAYAILSETFLYMTLQDFFHTYEDFIGRTKLCLQN